MRYLLDTAPWANSVLMPEILPHRIRRLIDGDEVKGLCSMSLMECAILHRRGRLQLRGELAEFFRRGVASDIELLELTDGIAVATNELPADFPGDPFDRVICATAKIMGLTLITCDHIIRDARFCAVEYYPFKPPRLNM